VSWGFCAPRGIRTPNRQIRSLVLRVDLVGSRPIWLLRLDASSIQTDPDGSCRILWMIKQARQLERAECSPSTIPGASVVADWRSARCGDLAWSAPGSLVVAPLDASSCGEETPRSRGWYGKGGNAALPPGGMLASCQRPPMG
jgi:hypothetical protein